MLMKLADNILNGMENKNISAVIARDLSAAFDTVILKYFLPPLKTTMEFLDLFLTG